MYNFTAANERLDLLKKMCYEKDKENSANVKTLDDGTEVKLHVGMTKEVALSFVSFLSFLYLLTFICLRQEERQEIEKQKLILAKLEEETELAQAKLNEKKQQEKEIKVFAFCFFLGSWLT